MNTIRANPSDPKAALQIGRRGENEVSEVIFDYSAWVAEFGPGVVSLLVRRSKDNSAYLVAMTSGAGNTKVWTITSTDTQYVGGGRAELIYTVDEQIAKSVVYKTNVLPDIGEPSETPPDPYETWLDTLTALGSEVEGYAQDAADSADAAEAAVAHYPYIGADNYWYVWNAETEQFVNTNVKALGVDGTNGTDGYSPTVTVEEITGGHRITITDANRTTTVDVMDGADGATGADGEDGFSPVVTVTDITGGHRVTITDKSGAHTFDVMDGQGGSGYIGADEVEWTGGNLGQQTTPPHVEQAVEAVYNVAVAKYAKPSGGIPKTDLASAVQTSLGKADTALQRYTETDPTVPSWAKAANKPSYTASEVGAIAAPSSPAAGAFLVWNGTAWVARTLSAWQGGSF